MMTIAIPCPMTLTIDENRSYKNRYPLSCPASLISDPLFGTSCLALLTISVKVLSRRRKDTPFTESRDLLLQQGVSQSPSIGAVTLLCFLPSHSHLHRAPTIHLDHRPSTQSRRFPVENQIVSCDNPYYVSCFY